MNRLARLVQLLLTTSLVIGMFVHFSFATSDISNFSLLYSTLGYDTRAVKRLLVRTVNEINPAEVNTKSSTWQLKDSNGNTRASGKLIYLGKTFGIQLWEIKFSSFQKTGTYHVEVNLIDSGGSVIGTLKTLNFKIEDRLLSKNILYHLTLDNAEARVANAYYGNGYYDCDSHMGETNSHPVFLYSLTQVYAYLQSSLNSWEKDRFKAATGRAFDYILSQQTANGTKYQYATRPYVRGIVGAQITAYGLAAYLNIFKNDDPSRCNAANYHRIVNSISMLEKPGKSQSPPRITDYLVSIYYHLYKYSGDIVWKNKAINSLNNFLSDFSFRTNSRLRGQPHFEGLYLMCKEFPTEAAKPGNDWIKKAIQIKDTYFTYIRDHNGFKVLPSSDPDNLASEWDDMTTMPRGRGVAHMLWNAEKLISAMEACFLAELTGDKSIMEVAAGSLGWIMGINPGLQRDALRNPPSSTELNDKQAASFISNLNARYAAEWVAKRWAYQNNRFMTVKNGFSNRNHPCVNLRRPLLENDFDYIYDIADVKGHINAESYIYHDGLLAYLICVLENYYYDTYGLPALEPVHFKTNLSGWMSSMGDWLHTTEGLKATAVLDPYHDCAEMTSSEIAGDFTYDADITVGASGGMPGLLFRANRYDPNHSGKGYVVKLDAEENKIKLCKLASPIRYEAETGICYGGAFEFREFGASNWERVGYLMNVEDGVSIEEVRSSTGGSTTITIGYSNGFDTRTKSLYVNGRRVSALTFPTTKHDWRWYSAIKTNVTLQVGNNTIAIQRDATDEPGTDIDYLEVPLTSSNANEIGSCAKILKKDTIYHLRVVARGNNIKVYFNNENTTPCIDCYDSTFTIGHFGLYLDEGTAVFQNVKVSDVSAIKEQSRYEAEDGDLLVGAQVIPALGASHGARVGSINFVGDGIKFNTYSNGGGNKIITIRYSLGPGRPPNFGQIYLDRSVGHRLKSLYVNDFKVGSVDFAPTGGWDTYATVTAKLVLVPGNNTIGIITDDGDGSAVDIDCIDILTDRAPTPTQTSNTNSRTDARYRRR